MEISKERRLEIEKKIVDLLKKFKALNLHEISKGIKESELVTLCVINDSRKITIYHVVPLSYICNDSIFYCLK